MLTTIIVVHKMGCIGYQEAARAVIADRAKEL